MKQQHIKKSKQEKSVSFQFKKGGENKIESYESIAGGVADALIYKQKKCSSSKSENLLLYIVNFIREFLQRTQIILLSLLLVFKLFFSGIFLNKVRFCPSNNSQNVKSIIQCPTNINQGWAPLKIFFSGWFALCLHLHIYIYLV